MIFAKARVSKIPISHSTHSVVQVPLSPLIRMFHFNISRAMAPGRRNASGDTLPLIIIPLMRWPKIFRSTFTFPLLTSWGLGLSTQTFTTPLFFIFQNKIQITNQILYISNSPVTKFKTSTFNFNVNLNSQVIYIFSNLRSP